MGTPIIPAKGHPNIALAAVDKMATCRWPRNQAPIDSRVMYIQKLLGRYAVEEINIPALSNKTARVILPVLAPNCLHTPL